MKDIIELLTDKIIEATNGNTICWHKVNAILNDEIPRIVQREIRLRVDEFVKSYQEYNNETRTS